MTLINYHQRPLIPFSLVWLNFPFLSLLNQFPILDYFSLSAVFQFTLMPSKILNLHSRSFPFQQTVDLKYYSYFIWYSIFPYLSSLTFSQSIHAPFLISLSKNPIYFLAYSTIITPSYKTHFHPWSFSSKAPSI